jgi:thiamine-monophosphate kinase
MDELERIAALTARFGGGGPGVIVGIGDDAAVLRASGDLVATVDVAVEDVHFRRAWAPLERLAYRAFMAAASDLAAMGAEPRGALLSLVLPASVGDDGFLELVAGVERAASTIGCPVIGGNLSAGTELSIGTTALGATAGEALRRRGARPGDGLFVTGRPGDRALGLEVLLRRGAPSGSAAARALVEAWLEPLARVDAGRALVGRATAAIDVSDGLLMDLDHLVGASGVGARVELGAIPRHDDFEAVASELGVDPLAPLLGGGDAYELLFTAPPDVDVSDVGARIGSIVAGSGVEVVDRGVTVRRPATGHRHFG